VVYSRVLYLVLLKNNSDEQDFNVEVILVFIYSAKLNELLNVNKNKYYNKLNLLTNV
jgi:hypothetical protein